MISWGLFAQNPLYVTPDGLGNQSGTSWDNALPGSALQNALVSAPSGTTVLVATGLYKPTTTDRTASFSIAAGVELYGGYTAGTTNRTTSPSSTTLSGDLNGNDSFNQNQPADLYHVVTVTTGTVVLDGLVITQGDARSTDPNINALANTGGGLLVVAGSLTLHSVELVKNVGRSGGGMFVKAGSINLTHCTFRDNNSNLGPGGGLAVNDGVTGSLTNCQFLENSTLFGEGAGMYLAADNFTLMGCRFVGKSEPLIANADPRGGGLYLRSADWTILINCVFSQNKAYQGGAIYNDLSEAVLLNCSFSGNRSSLGGSALYSRNSGRFWLYNSILWGNQSDNGGSAYNTEGEPIIYYNYTNTQDGVQSGPGNASVNPQFVDAANHDLRLSACSPLIDRGNSTASFTPPNAVTYPIPDTDIASNARRVRTIDLGAYEFQGTSAILGITQQPASGTVARLGATVTTSVSVTGTAAGYQWYKDGTSLGTAQQTPTLMLTNVTPAQAGSYLVVVSGNCNSVTSTAFNLAVSLFSTATLYVTPDGLGSRSGTSWDNALPGSALQNALVSAPSGTTVLVAAGLYKPTTTTDRTASFSIAAGVELYGGYTAGTTNRTTSPSSTTLSGDLNGNDSFNQNQPADLYHVVTVTTGTVVLDGLVITQGDARSTDPNINALANTGGGLLVVAGSLTLHSVDFVNNYGRSGGGMYVRAGSVNLTHCRFRQNNSRFGNGGGLYVSDGVTGSLTNCEFWENYTSFGNGSGMYLAANNFTLTSCGFVGKPGPVIANADPNGGALYVSAAKGVVLTNCLFSSNNGVQGGAIYNSLSDLILFNCSFIGNRSYYSGSALYSEYGRFWLFNSIIWGNQSEQGGSAYSNRDNSPPIISYSYTDMQDGVQPGAGNVSVDPQFVDAVNSDFRLSGCSPLVDAGNSTASYNVANVGTYTIPDTDLAGYPRRVRTIDLGAYEFQASPTAGIIQQPTSATTVCAGTTVTVSVSVTGTVVGYQWYKDGTSLGTAQQAPILTLTNVTPAQAGSYLVVVSGNCNSVTSTTFNLSVNPTPVVSLSNTGAITCAQPQVTLKADPSGQANYAFTGPGLNQSGPNNTAIVTQGGTYSLVVTNASGCSASATTTLQQNLDLPTPTLQTATGQTRLTVPQYSGTVTLLIAGCSGTINWTGPNNSAGTTTTITVPTTQTGNLVYQATCQLGSCTSVPASATITVQVQALQLLVDRYDCASRQLMLRTTGGNGQPIDYQINSVTNGWQSASVYVLESKHMGRELKLRARQRNPNGGWNEAEISFTPRACGARLGAEAVELALQVKLLGNPVEGQRVEVEVEGADGQPLSLRLVDLSGQLLDEQQRPVAQAVERVSLRLGEGAGQYLLQVSTPNQRQTLKVLKAN